MLLLGIWHGICDQEAATPSRSTFIVITLSKLFVHMCLYHQAVSAKGRWCSAAEKVTVGLASRWPCVTDWVHRTHVQGRNVGLKSGGYQFRRGYGGVLGHMAVWLFGLGAKMVGSGKKAVGLSRPKGPRAGVCSWEGQPAPTQQSRGLPSGVWGAAQAEIEFGAF